MRYSAFISYNHRDQAHARWLLRALESYRLPRHLRDRPGRDGKPVGARLKPVFRDRDELATSSDLADSVRAALEESESLVVICSPFGARSRWVNEEIRHFTRLGRRDRVLCIIVGGEPHAADPELECLPPALFDDGASEPLAADIRPLQDHKDDARLKLISAILGLGFDELRRREHARRVRRLTAIAAGSTAGLVITAGLAWAAYLARNEAVRQRDVARVRSITAERTVEFVKGMFAVSDPSEARGATITAREVLDRGARDYAQALANEPVVRAEIGLTLSEVYGALGLYRESERLVRAADALPQDARTVRTRQAMLQAESKFRLGEYAQALKGFESAVAAARSDDIARETLLPRALVGLGQTHSALEGYSRAEAVLREALTLVESRATPGERDVAPVLEALAENAFHAGELTRAVELRKRAWSIRLANEGENSPSVSDNISALASIAYMQGDNPEAEKLFRSRLAIDERVLGPDHPDVATTLNNIGRILLERRAFAEAGKLLDRAAANALRERGAMHDDMAFILANQGLARLGLGRDAEAEALLKQARTSAQAHGHRMFGPILVDLASIACRQHRIGEGTGLLDAARLAMRKDYPNDAWRLAWLETVHAECLWIAGNVAAARRLFGENAATVAARWAPSTLFGAELERRKRRLDAG